MYATTTTTPTQAPARPAATMPATAAEWAARIVSRHPALARPVAEALALAEAGNVSGNDMHCMVVNRERTTRYSLDYDAATGAWTCTCPAHAYLTYRDGRTYFYETDRSNGRRWRTLTCHEARDGRWPQQFGLENPTTPGRQQRRALRDDTLLAVTEEAMAPTD